MKPQNSVSIGERREVLSVVAELAAAEVCAWVGLPTPATGVLVMPDEIEDDALLDRHREELRETFAINRGTVAFCSRMLDLAADADVSVVERMAARRPGFRDSCANLYAVDAFVRHDDRTVERPNCLLWREQLVAIDHGHAFAWLDKVGYDGEAVARMTAWLQPAWKRHIVRQALQKQRKKARDP